MRRVSASLGSCIPAHCISKITELITQKIRYRFHQLLAFNQTQDSNNNNKRNDGDRY